MPRSLRSASLAVALTAALGPRAAGAQLAILRTSEASPLDVEPGRRFPTPAFVGDIARGYGSTEDARAWDVTLAGLVQLRTRSGRSAVVVQVGNEMTANPYNAGGLNPRGTSWEEAVYVVHRFGVFDARSGVFFRCRHEVDGASPIDDRPESRLRRIGTRDVATKGVDVGLATRELTPATRLRLRVGASADRFFDVADWRLPASGQGPDWTQARGRITATVRLAYVAGRAAAPYVRGWTSTTFFDGSRDPMRAAHGTGARVETGVRLGTGGGAADLFAARERFFDDLSNTTPQRSTVLAFGLRLGSAAFF